MKVLLLEPRMNLRTILLGVIHGVDQVQVFTPTTSFEAVKLLLSHDIDLLICSERSKPIIGKDLTKLLRGSRDMLTRQTPVMIVTSANTVEEIKELLAVGVDEVLCIPFSYNAVRARIHRVWHNRAKFLEYTTYVGPDRRRTDVYGIEPERRDGGAIPAIKKFTEDLSVRVKTYLAKQIARKKVEEDASGKEAAVVISKSKPSYSATAQPIKKTGRIGVRKNLKELEPGMMLAENVLSSTGLLILDTKNPLSSTSITRLTDMVNVGRVEDNFHIQP